VFGSDDRGFVLQIAPQCDDESHDGVTDQEASTMTLILALVAVVLVGAVFVIVAVHRLLVEGYEAVAQACGMTTEEFGLELTDGRSAGAVARDCGIDVDAVMQATMRTSRYRWASSLASRMR